MKNESSRLAETTFDEGVVGFGDVDAIMSGVRLGMRVVGIDLLDEFRFAYESVLDFVAFSNRVHFIDLHAKGVVLEREEVELELHVRFERVRQWKLKVSTFDRFHRTKVDFVRRCIWFVLPLSSNGRG